VTLVFAAIAAHGGLVRDADRGAGIPLWFMRAPAVVVTPCRALSNDEHVRAGAALARATGDRRVAFIGSADHGHGHTADGPYGFAPESREYDEQIIALVRENRLGSSPAGTRGSP
jgi:aromatic ring-opening dioxygenase LigB subunit